MNTDAEDVRGDGTKPWFHLFQLSHDKAPVPVEFCEGRVSGWLDASIGLRYQLAIELATRVLPCWPLVNSAFFEASVSSCSSSWLWWPSVPWSIFPWPWGVATSAMRTSIRDSYGAYKLWLRTTSSSHHDCWAYLSISGIF